MWLFLKNLIFTAVVPGFVGGWVPLVFLLHRTPVTAPSTWRQYAALPLLLIGVVVYFICLWQFGKIGRGTPADFDPPRKLITRGFYRWVRNPMYLSFLVLMLGEALYFWSLTLLLYTVFLASAFQLLVLAVEENALRRRFGAIYSDYCNNVNRWLPRKPKPNLQTVPPFSVSR